MVFIGIDLGLFGRILHERVDKYIIINDGRYVLSNIDTYHKVQVSEETCNTNACDNLTYLNVTVQFTGGGVSPNQQMGLCYI